MLSVVIPSYNETENLKNGSLEKVRDFFKKQKYSWEIIISEDESPDLESRKLAKEFCEKNPGFLFLQNQHGGKAKAIWAGTKAAKGELVLFTDMDQSTPIAEITKLLPFFDKGFDLVIGSRGLERKNFSLFRKIASGVFRTFRRTLLLGDIIDTQAGFKCIKKSVALEIFPLLSAIEGHSAAKGWTVTSYDVEMLVAARTRGYKVVEVPIEWEDRDESVAKAKERKQGKFVKESIDMLKEIFRVKTRQVLGKYNK